MNISRFTKLTLIFAIVALIGGLSACDQIQQVLFPPQPEMPPEMPGVIGEPITIGVSLPLDSVWAPLYGLPMKHGFELAQEELNQLGGPKISLSIENDQGTVEGAKAAFNTLIDEYGVSIIIGICFSTQLRAVSSHSRRERGCML